MKKVPGLFSVLVFAIGIYLTEPVDAQIGTLAVISITILLFALFLSFVGGTRRTLGRKWRRFVVGSIFLICFGWLLTTFVGYVWEYQEVRDYYERIFKELIRPQRPTRPNVDKNVLEA